MRGVRRAVVDPVGRKVRLETPDLAASVAVSVLPDYRGRRVMTASQETRETRASLALADLPALQAGWDLLACQGELG